MCISPIIRGYYEGRHQKFKPKYKEEKIWNVRVILQQPLPGLHHNVSRNYSLIFSMWRLGLVLALRFMRPFLIAFMSCFDWRVEIGIEGKFLPLALYLAKLYWEIFSAWTLKISTNIWTNEMEILLSVFDPIFIKNYVLA